MVRTSSGGPGEDPEAVLEAAWAVNNNRLTASRRRVAVDGANGD